MQNYTNCATIVLSICLHTHRVRKMLKICNEILSQYKLYSYVWRPTWPPMTSVMMMVTRIFWDINHLCTAAKHPCKCKMKRKSTPESYYIALTKYKAYTNLTRHIHCNNRSQWWPWGTMCFVFEYFQGFDN